MASGRKGLKAFVRDTLTVLGGRAKYHGNIPVSAKREPRVLNTAQAPYMTLRVWEINLFTLFNCE